MSSHSKPADTKHVQNSCINQMIDSAGKLLKNMGAGSSSSAGDRGDVDHDSVNTLNCDIEPCIFMGKNKFGATNYVLNSPSRIVSGRRRPKPYVRKGMDVAECPAVAGCDSESVDLPSASISDSLALNDGKLVDGENDVIERALALNLINVM